MILNMSTVTQEIDVVDHESSINDGVCCNASSLSKKREAIHVPLAQSSLAKINFVGGSGICNVPSALPEDKISTYLWFYYVIILFHINNTIKIHDRKSFFLHNRWKPVKKK
jgi:hypothetical protein